MAYPEVPPYTDELPHFPPLYVLSQISGILPHKLYTSYKNRKVISGVVAFGASNMRKRTSLASDALKEPAENV